MSALVLNFFYAFIIYDEWWYAFADIRYYWRRSFYMTNIWVKNTMLKYKEISLSISLLYCWQERRPSRTGARWVRFRHDYRAARYRLIGLGACRLFQFHYRAALSPRAPAGASVLFPRPTPRMTFGAPAGMLFPAPSHKFRLYYAASPPPALRSAEIQGWRWWGCRAEIWEAGLHYSSYIVFASIYTFLIFLLWRDISGHITRVYFDGDNWHFSPVIISL